MRRWLNMKPPFAWPRNQAHFISRLDSRTKKSRPLPGRWELTARRLPLANHRHNKASNESKEKSPVELLRSACNPGLQAQSAGKLTRKAASPDFYTANAKNKAWTAAALGCAVSLP